MCLDTDKAKSILSKGDYLGIDGQVVWASADTHDRVLVAACPDGGRV
jgi:hypothetical protein